MDNQPRFQPVDLDGPRGETLLSHPVTYIMPADRQLELQESFNRLIGHVAELHDDRLLALTAALVIENCVDMVLQSVMPRFTLLMEDDPFSFGERTRIAKALDLIPRRFLAAADAIRQIRNDFAHNLEVKSFDQLKTGRMAAVKERLREFSLDLIGDNPTNAQMVERLVQMAALGLMIYKYHLAVFSRGTRHEDFAGYMKSFVQRHGSDLTA